MDETNFMHEKIPSIKNNSLLWYFFVHMIRT